MSDDQQADEFYGQPTKQVSEKTVIVAPGSGKAVGLGVYQATAPSPEVQVTYQPDLHDDIGVSHERLEIPGQSKYVLLYQFHNFSQKSCQVTMHLSGV